MRYSSVPFPRRAKAGDRAQNQTGSNMYLNSPLYSITLISVSAFLSFVSFRTQDSWPIRTNVYSPKTGTADCCGSIIGGTETTPMKYNTSFCAVVFDMELEIQIQFRRSPTTVADCNRHLSAAAPRPVNCRPKLSAIRRPPFIWPHASSPTVAVGVWRPSIARWHFQLLSPSTSRRSASRPSRATFSANNKWLNRRRPPTALRRPLDARSSVAPRFAQADFFSACACASVAWWLRRWICDQQIERVRLQAVVALSGVDPGKVVLIHMCLCRQGV